MGRSRISFTVWQPETDNTPWAVSVQETCKNKLTVTIYHAGLKRDHVTFHGMRLHNAREFANFTAKMLQMCSQFANGIEVRNQDVRALYQGYERSLQRALSPDSLDLARITERKE